MTIYEAVVELEHAAKQQPLALQQHGLIVNEIKTDARISSKFYRMLSKQKQVDMDDILTVFAIGVAAGKLIAAAEILGKVN